MKKCAYCDAEGVTCNGSLLWTCQNHRSDRYDPTEYQRGLAAGRAEIIAAGRAYLVRRADSSFSVAHLTVLTVFLNECEQGESRRISIWAIHPEQCVQGKLIENDLSKEEAEQKLVSWKERGWPLGWRYEIRS
jgi:hypothetical protein